VRCNADGTGRLTHRTEGEVGPASNAINLGHEVSIMVEGSEPALGAR